MYTAPNPPLPINASALKFAAAVDNSSSVKIFTGGPWCGNFAFCTGDLLFEDAYPPDRSKEHQASIRKLVSLRIGIKRLTSLRISIRKLVSLRVGISNLPSLRIGIRKLASLELVSEAWKL
jgi:hypothetical protein